VRQWMRGRDLAQRVGEIGVDGMESEEGRQDDDKRQHRELAGSIGMEELVLSRQEMKHVS
jgi:hypothetical protein